MAWQTGKKMASTVRPVKNPRWRRSRRRCRRRRTFIGPTCTSVYWRIYTARRNSRDFIASTSRRCGSQDANEARPLGEDADTEISIAVERPGRGRGWIQQLTMTCMMNMMWRARRPKLAPRESRTPTVYMDLERIAALIRSSMDMHGQPKRTLLYSSPVCPWTSSRCSY